MKKVSIKLITLIIFASASIIAALTVVTSSYGKEIKEISLGNKYLSEVDYQNAMVSYSKAIEINPNSIEALEGLMQASYYQKDYKTLCNTVMAYTTVMKSQGLTTEAEHKICQMARNSYPYFETNQEYIDYIYDLCEGVESEELSALKLEAQYAVIAQSMSEGNLDEADSLLDRILTDCSEADLIKAKVNILEKCAETEWKNRNFDAAIEYLKQALELAQYDKEVKDDLLRVIEDYVAELKNTQDYDKADELIAWLSEIRGEKSLQDISISIADMRRVDDNLQGMIDELNGYFEADDIDSIKKLMSSDDYKESTKKIERVLLSKNLLGGSSVTGKGTAIYNVNSSYYVYYGDFKNGKREGQGLWYYLDPGGTLAKYSLEWVNNLPNGYGTADYYSTLSIRGYGGVLLNTYQSHTTDTFTTVNGVYNGDYESKGVTSYTSYTFKYSYTDGYGPRLEPGSYPSEIAQYMEYPRALTAYVKDAWGDYVWQYWGTGRKVIDGLNLAQNSFENKGYDLVKE